MAKQAQCEFAGRGEGSFFNPAILPETLGAQAYKARLYLSSQNDVAPPDLCMPNKSQFQKSWSAVSKLTQVVTRITLQPMSFEISLTSLRYVGLADIEGYGS